MPPWGVLGLKIGGKWKLFAVLALQECNNLELMFYESKSRKISSVV